MALVKKANNRKYGADTKKEKKTQVGMYTVVAILENDTEVPHKPRIGTIVWSSTSISGYILKEL